MLCRSHSFHLYNESKKWAWCLSPFYRPGHEDSKSYETSKWQSLNSIVAQSWTLECPLKDWALLSQIMPWGKKNLILNLNAWKHRDKELREQSEVWKDACLPKSGSVTWGHSFRISQLQCTQFTNMAMLLILKVYGVYVYTAPEINTSPPLSNGYLIMSLRYP